MGIGSRRHLTIKKDERGACLVVRRGNPKNVCSDRAPKIHMKLENIVA